MAGKKLSWLFEILDRMSPPAKRITRALDDVERKLTKGATASKQLGRETRGAGDAARRAGDSFGWFGLKLSGWIYLARSALGLMSGLARGGIGLASGFLGAGIKAASFKESTMLGLNMILRDKGQAKALYNEAVNFADISPFETVETLQWYRSLTGALGPGAALRGLGKTGPGGGSNVLKILSGLGDIASTRPVPSVAMEGLLRQVTQMLGKGKLMGSDLNIMSEHGMIRSEVYQRLAKRHGITLAEAMSPAWEGKFGAGESLEAMLQFSAARFGGGKLGGGMGPAALTFTGLLSTLKSRPYRLMEDLGNTKGFQALKGALQNLVNVLDPSTPQGARIKANVEHLFDRILGGLLKGFETPDAMEKWVNGLLDGIEKLIPKIGEAAEAIGRMADRAAPLLRFLAGPGTPLDTSRATLGVGEHPSWSAADKARQIIEGSGGKLTRDQMEVWKGAYKEFHGAPPPSPSSAPEKGPTSLNIPGGIHVHVNGAQDARAVGDEVESRLAALFERLAMHEGTA